MSLPENPVALLILLVGLAAGCATSEPATQPAPPPAEEEAPQQARAPEVIPELPEIPSEGGAPRIYLAYPPSGAVKPNADSTFIFGSVGNGDAQLTVNGIQVPVAPNGAFLTYLPVPEDDTYRFVAEAAGQTARQTYTYGQPLSTDLVTPLPQPRIGKVITGSDTLASGSQITSATPVPRGDRRWFFPRGAELTITGELAELYRVRLTDDRDAWVAKTTVQLTDPLPSSRPAVGTPTVAEEGRRVDVRLPVDFAPFQIQTRPDGAGITLYNRAPSASLDLSGSSFINSASWASSAADSAQLQIEFGEALWGYKAFYEDDGTLVVRFRRPPSVDTDEPLRGLRVMVDAGHPPGGAVGPTGLTEAEANLAIALRMADMLEARGAEVVLTRNSAAPLENATNVADELWARVDLAVDRNVDLLVSVHNNAFPDGTNPFEHYGTETYYFNRFTEPMAESLVEELVQVTGLPNLGAKRRSLALTRPTWMPSVLTESLFMMFPQQEAALKNPDFLEALARAHVEGLEDFVRSSAVAAE